MLLSMFINHCAKQNFCEKNTLQKWRSIMGTNTDFRQSFEARRAFP